MSEEDPMELPDELKKLKIHTTAKSPPIEISQDSNLPVNLNPFYYEVKFKDPPASTTMTSEDSAAKNIFGSGIQYTCRHNINRLRNRLDYYQGHNYGNYHNHHLSELSKKSLKAKSYENNRRKIILKEPILKCFRNCIHYLNKLVISDEHADLEAGSLSTLVSNCTNLDKLKIENGITETVRGRADDSPLDPNNRFNLSPIGLNEYLDLRNLKKEKNLITSSNCSSNAATTSKLSNESAVNISDNFTTPQTRTKSKNNFHIVANSPDERPDQQTINININDGSTLPINQSNASVASSSCSQQARINASTTNCDITIDELASYFETFVHIPKKMSTMAEMMYI